MHSYIILLQFYFLCSVLLASYKQDLKRRIILYLTGLNSALLFSGKLLQRNFVSLSLFFYGTRKTSFHATTQLFKNISVILYLYCLFVFKEGSTKSVLIIFHPDIF